MASDIDFTSPAAQFSFDLNKSPVFKKDNQNFINILSIQRYRQEFCVM